MDPHREFVFQATGLHFDPRAMSLAFVESFVPGAVATFGGKRGTVAGYGGALYKVANDLAETTRDS
jgi:hypothetical protein